MSDVKTAPPTGRVKTGDSDIDRYTSRRPAKHQAEMALVERTFPRLAEGSKVLDAPCGAGRISLWAAQQGWVVSSLDLGTAAVGYTRELLTSQGFHVTATEGNIFAMPWEDRSFSAVICFRLLHHFADANDRQKLVLELARVSGGHLLISYLSPWSFTGIKRRLRQLFTGKRYTQNHTPLSELIRILKGAGFKLIRDKGQLGLFHSLHLAHFQRI
jgi:2-polyprenyl-3-methyl-5-hydroxy-6-metoxy-1,4-benzoquinol methylase